MLWRFMRNSLDSGAFKSQQAQWDQIDLPMWAVGNWSGMAMHLRGNTEGYMRAASKHKKLRIHTGTHFHPFYSEEGRRDQLRWFDHWLKGIDNGVMEEPPVKLAIRTGHGEYQFRHENEWPLARTQWTKLYLDISKPDGAEGKGIAGTPARQPSRRRPRSAPIPRPAPRHGGHISRSRQDAGISLVTPPLTHDTEITGPLMAKLWVSSTTEDMDICSRCATSIPTARTCCEVGQHGQPVPVAKGWLRASHRKLDPEKSLPYRPYHEHRGGCG